jgi:light-regulated signal transduction histidine kinase (bacteriophytochrome)
VDMLRRNTAGKIDAQNVHYIERITRAANHMGALIDGLLAFSRTGRRELVRRKVSLAKVIQDARNEALPDTHGRTIEWTIGPMPDIVGDPTLLRLAFANLIDNAIKYTRPTPDAHIEITAEQINGSETVVMVRDNGVGFDMNYVHRLFGVFQRLHSAEEFEGTGVGLANVARIIQRHGGRVWAEGVKGRGASFFVSIPRKGAQ